MPSPLATLRLAANGGCRTAAALGMDLFRSSIVRCWSMAALGRRLGAMSTTANEGSRPGDETPPELRERRSYREERRAMTLKTFLRGGFLPRRRNGRRVTDGDLPFDFHEPYLLILAVVMLGLSVADALLTVKLMSDGAEETNPLLAFVLNEHPRLFAVVKMALTGAGVVLLVALSRTRVFRVVRAGVFLPLLALAYLGLVVYEAWLVGNMP
jgi:hypothetical protein